MQFRAEFNPRTFKEKIRHSQNLLLIGSCFTEQIGAKLIAHKFHVLQNPNGILFNPVSISRALKGYIDKKQYSEEDLFYYNEAWASWDHHSRFSGLDKNEVLQQINNSQINAGKFLDKAHWLMITLGSAFVYERTNVAGGMESVVSNCHKVPADKFNRRLLSADEVKNVLSETIKAIRKHRPYIKIVFTISPVRHLREGFIENNRSKANLISAVHGLTDEESVLYFPAYELVIDDLRDYRFFAEDLAHPNYAATNYVWEKFVSSCIDESSVEIMKEVAAINNAVNHKPFNPNSEQHQKFRETFLKKAIHLLERFPHLDLQAEISFLGDT